MASSKKLYLAPLLLLLLIPFAYAQTPSNPFYMHTAWMYNATDIRRGYPDSSTSMTASSQDFQTIFPYQDQSVNQVNDRVILNFGTSCKATTNTTTVRALNNNTISSISNASFVALIERSADCLWAEKISTAMSIANANQLNMAAALIYDNISYPDSNPVYNATVGSTSTPSYPNPLPAARSISNMTDNNIMTGALTIAVYFASNTYGISLLQKVNAANAASVTDNKEVWLFRPILYPTCWTDCPDALTSMLAASKGYLSYIIGLAAIFLIAAIVLRWWRMRRFREQMAHRGDLEHGVPLRNRTTKVHPLPVDILNTYPVQSYDPSVVKNGSCAICLDDFTPDKTNIRVLPCGHGFCTGCIDPWLTDKSPLCPICKHDCLPPELRLNADLVEQNNHLQLGSASPYTSPSAAAAAALATSSIAETPSTSVEVHPPTTPPPAAFPLDDTTNHPDMAVATGDHQNVEQEHMTPPPSPETTEAAESMEPSSETTESTPETAEQKHH